MLSLGIALLLAPLPAAAVAPDPPAAAVLIQDPAPVAAALDEWIKAHQRGKIDLLFLRRRKFCQSRVRLQETA